ncbi:DUF5363 domain-containing protein [Pasteurella bettyae]|uniref:Uncharacterized protein n=1 Tax=Pasteurella bettyae CCUG 2042 TaxID=1095749 RepID=I3D7J7_9PAST|nr:DUF5363 domain-containing protein [Pasteurella bettyae]EIJ67690.1 hypothetical protein HMPREF1052_0547 [Pasteurella bettyae CCUG 2042]SUB22132.1 Uncharacterised protein [Pasteurella bettyae]
MQQCSEKMSWFKKMLKKYTHFCKEFGYDNTVCRGCGIPEIKVDAKGELIKNEAPDEK